MKVLSRKKGHDAFNCQRSAKNISNKPGVIAPVGAELKLKNDARGYSNGEVDAEEFHPEFGDPLPFGIPGAVIHGLHKGQHVGQSQR